MEKVGHDHPMHKLRAKKPIQAAAKRMEEKGTKGAFTAEAKNSGQSVQERASANYNKPGLEGQRARFAYLAGHGWKGKAK